MTDSARRRSRERLEERETEILDAAARLFASGGFHATSTRRIAAAAGVSEGTVFHYFGSKNELMLGILDRFYNDVLNARAAQILDTIMGTRERLRALAQHHASALAADNALMMRLLQVYVGVDLEYMGDGDESPLRALNRSYVGHLDRILREGMERGELRNDLELRPQRDVFFGSLEYGLRTHVYRHGVEGLEDYIDSLLHPLWQSMVREDTPATNAPGSGPDGPGQLARQLQEVCSRLEGVADRLEKP